MNFYQKISAAITIVLLAVTFAIAFVCFSAPFSGIFTTQLTALAIAELILGGIGFYLHRERDNALAFSVAAFWSVGFIYFLFVLIMFAVASSSIAVKYFILIHSIGFAFSLILFLLFLMGHHGIGEQQAETALLKAGKKQLMQKASLLFAALQKSFPQEKAFSRECEKVLEDIRFSPDSNPSTELIEHDIYSLLDGWEKLDRTVVDEHKKMLTNLKELVEKRSITASL